MPQLQIIRHDVKWTRNIWSPGEWEFGQDNRPCKVWAPELCWGGQGQQWIFFLMYLTNYGSGSYINNIHYKGSR